MITDLPSTTLKLRVAYMAPVVRTIDLKKTYGGKSQVQALNEVSIEIRQGERTALLGKS